MQRRERRATHSRVTFSNLVCKILTLYNCTGCTSECNMDSFVSEELHRQISCKRKRKMNFCYSILKFKPCLSKAYNFYSLIIFCSESEDVSKFKNRKCNFKSTILDVGF